MEEPSEIEDWKRISVLGAGSFGKVTLWKNQITQETMAIKKCRLTDLSQISQRQRERWQDEVDIMKKIKNENIVKYKALPEILEATLARYNPSQLPILSMEYCTEGNLRYLLSKPLNLCGLQEENVRAVLTDITNAVHYLHGLNIIHRDIKPENIVLQKCNGRKCNLTFKLIDLGYAKELINSQISFVGTLHYIAPEIFKNVKYNRSVDYFSLGTLYFEVICGILPFLPDSTPVERFRFLENKHPDHICITMENKKPQFKTKFPRETHLSQCLQHNVEIWLRHVLQYDLEKRLEKFPNGIDVFEYMQRILRKKIVNVFSLFNRQFYSYEINDETSVEILKEWIFKDTQIESKDQVILSKTRLFGEDSKELVMKLVSDDDMNLYMVKKSTFIGETSVNETPEAVKFLFDNVREEFQWRQLKQLYAEIIYYFMREVRFISDIKEIFSLYIKYVGSTSRKVQAEGQLIELKLDKLIVMTESYEKITNSVKNIFPVDNNLGSKFIQYKECLLKLGRIFNDLKKNVLSIEEFKTKVHSVNVNYHKLMEEQEKLQAVLDDFDDFDDHLNEACIILKMACEHSKRGHLSCRPMYKLVTAVLKKKDELFYNDTVQRFTSSLSKILIDAEALLEWSKDCDNHLNQLSSSLDILQLQRIEILSKNTLPNGTKTVRYDSNGIKDCSAIETMEIINDNITARTSFLELLSALPIQKL